MEPSSVQEEVVLPDDMLALLGAKCWLVEPNIIFTCKAALKGFEHDFKNVTTSLDHLDAYACVSSPLEVFERDLKKMENIYRLVEIGEKDKVSEKDWDFVNKYIMDIDYVKTWCYVQYEPQCLDMFRRMLKIVPVLNSELHMYHLDSNSYARFRNLRSERPEEFVYRKGAKAIRDIIIDRLAPSKEEAIDPDVPLLKQLDYSGSYLNSGYPVSYDNSIFISGDLVEGVDYPPEELQDKKLEHSTPDYTEEELLLLIEKMRNKEIEIVVTTKHEKVATVEDQEKKVLVTEEKAMAIVKGITNVIKDSGMLESKREAWYLDKNIRSMLKVLELLDDIVRNAPGCTTEYWYDSANRLLSCKDYLGTCRGNDGLIGGYLEEIDMVYYREERLSMLYTDHLSEKGRTIHCDTEDTFSYLYMATAPLQCLEICNIVEKDPVTARSMFRFLKRGVVPTMYLTKYMYKALWKYEEFRQDLSKYAIVFRVDTKKYENIIGSKYSLDSRFLPGTHIKASDSHSRDVIPLKYNKEELESLIQKYENIELRPDGEDLGGVPGGYSKHTICIPISAFLQMIQDCQTRMKSVKIPENVHLACYLKYQDFAIHEIISYLAVMKVLYIYRNSPDLIEVIKILRQSYPHWEDVICCCQILEYRDLLPGIYVDTEDTLTGIYSDKEKEKHAVLNIVNPTTLLAPLRCKTSKDPNIQEWFDSTWDRIKEEGERCPRKAIAKECIISMIPSLFWKARDIGVVLEDYPKSFVLLYLYRYRNRSVHKIAKYAKRMLLKLYPDASSETLEEEFKLAFDEFNDI